jgi:hypothetical protein
VHDTSEREVTRLLRVAGGLASSWGLPPPSATILS